MSTSISSVETSASPKQVQDAARAKLQAFCDGETGRPLGVVLDRRGVGAQASGLNPLFTLGLGRDGKPGDGHAAACFVGIEGVDAPILRVYRKEAGASRWTQHDFILKPNAREEGAYCWRPRERTPR